MAASKSLPIRKRMDDFFLASMAGLILLTVFIGFARTYYLAGAFHAHLPSLLVHFHGAIFTCWILVFVAQIALAYSHHIRWHMRLGISGLCLRFSWFLSALRPSLPLCDGMPSSPWDWAPYLLAMFFNYSRSHS
jgi:hypothetical protein